MSVLSWLYFCFLFGVEVIFVNRCYWGLAIRNNKWFCVISVVVGIALSYFLKYIHIVELEFSVIWCVFLVFFVFDVSVIKTLKHSIITILIISMWENLVLSVGIIFEENISIMGGEKFNLLYKVIAFFLFVIITLFLQLKKCLPIQIIKYISIGQALLLIIGLLLSNFFLAMMYGFMLGEMTPNLARHAVAFCILTVVFVVFIFFYLIQTIQKKNFLEQVNKLEESYLHSQTSYYERVMIQDEELRKFRHDIRHHFFVLGRLSEEDRMDELKEYVGRLQESGVTKSVSYTGHTLIDALFSQIFQKHIQAEDISFSFHGKIPSTFSLENSAICILFANAFQNACEELEKQEGNGKFEMEIRGDGGGFFVFIRNTLRREHPFLVPGKKERGETEGGQRKAPILDTDKEDWKNHGFGTKNMKKVAGECGVDLEWWIVNEKWMEVRMGFFA